MADELPAAYGKAPPMFFVNLRTNDFLEAQFNPAEFEEVLGTNWAKQTIPGLSHQVKQFIHTEDVKFDLELFYHAKTDGGQIAALKDLHKARLFLYSACHPRRANSIAGGGSPRIVFCWPNMISLQCVLTNLRLNYVDFNIQGTPTALRAKVSMEEIRDAHVTMEDILTQGTWRSGSVPAGS